MSDLEYFTTRTFVMDKELIPCFGLYEKSKKCGKCFIFTECYEAHKTFNA